MLKFNCWTQNVSYKIPLVHPGVMKTKNTIDIKMVRRAERKK